MKNNSSIKALFIVTNAGYADEIMNLLHEAGAEGATILNSRGENERHESFMGITIDLEKEMIVCVVRKDIAEKAMILIKERAGIQTPAHSVCFTMPVDNLVGTDIPYSNLNDKEN